MEGGGNNARIHSLENASFTTLNNIDDVLYTALKQIGMGVGGVSRVGFGNIFNRYSYIKCSMYP